MSKQLSISAAFAIFAMAAFGLFASPNTPFDETGATVGAAAPALKVLLPGL